MTAPGDDTNRRSAPIGVFDSGLGGLSVVRQLQTELPRESLLYIADSLYCPYGVRSVAEICMRSRLLVGDLVAAGVKMVVVACNTASAAAIDLIRAEFEIPIVAMEPAVKPAITLTTSGKIAVLATPRTASSERLQLLIQRWGTGIDIRAIGVPGLADLVEAGEWSGPGVASLLVPIVAAQVTDGVDVIVLGCTHYPFAQETIRAIAGPDVRIIDSGNAVARRSRDQLIHHDLHATVGQAATFTMWTTGDPTTVATIASRLLGRSIQVAAVPPANTIGHQERSQA